MNREMQPTTRTATPPVHAQAPARHSFEAPAMDKLEPFEAPAMEMLSLRLTENSYNGEGADFSVYSSAA